MGYEVKYAIPREGRSDEDVCAEWTAIIAAREQYPHCVSIDPQEVILRFTAQPVPREDAA